MKTTTLREIRATNPCRHKWEELLEGLNKTKVDDEPLKLSTVSHIVGFESACWLLKTRKMGEVATLLLSCMANTCDYITFRGTMETVKKAYERGDIRHLRVLKGLIQRVSLDPQGGYTLALLREVVLEAIEIVMLTLERGSEEFLGMELVTIVLRVMGRLTVFYRVDDLYMSFVVWAEE